MNNNKNNVLLSTPHIAIELPVSVGVVEPKHD